MDLTADRHAGYLGTRHHDALDGIRSFAILAVIGHHVGGGHRNAVLDRGLGVTLFFGLSGFVITALLLRERRERGAVSLYAFYVRRSLRILPLYYAVLALYVVLVAATERTSAAGLRFFADLPYYLTFTSNLFVRAEGQHNIFYFAWSLATQEQFYLLWPLLIRFSRNRWLPPAVMGLLIVVGEGARLAIAAGSLPHLGLAARVLGNIPTPICLGSIAAYVLERRRGFGWAWSVAGQGWSVPLLLLALALPSLVDLGTMQVAFTSLVLVLLIVACVVHPGNLLQPLLANIAVRSLGRVSYGVYLGHMLALNGARRLLPGRSTATLFVVGTILCWLAAGASYLLFERRVVAAGTRWLLPGQATEPRILAAPPPAPPPVAVAARQG